MAGDEAGLHALAGALGGMMALTATFPLMTVRGAAAGRQAARRHGGERGERNQDAALRGRCVLRGRGAWHGESGVSREGPMSARYTLHPTTTAHASLLLPAALPHATAP